MIAALIESRRPGSGSWIAVRHTKVIRLTGFQDGHEDVIKVHLKGNEHEGIVLMFRGEGETNIPKGVTAIRAEHAVSSKKSRISVDLI
jgi:hypothetical protein